MSDFTVKHKFQLRMTIIPFHIRNVLSSPTETKLPPSSGRAAILMKEDTKHVKYNHVGKGFIGASKATAYRSLHACSLMLVQRTFFGSGAPASGEATFFLRARAVGSRLSKFSPNLHK